MPNCFQLTRKGDTEPTSPLVVDEAICLHLGVPIHPDNWVYRWYDIIGLGLACGRTFAEMAAMDLGPDLDRVVEFLSDNFTADAWAERR